MLIVIQMAIIKGQDDRLGRQPLPCSQRQDQLIQRDTRVPLCPQVSELLSQSLWRDGQIIAQRVVPIGGRRDIVIHQNGHLKGARQPIRRRNQHRRGRRCRSRPWREIAPPGPIEQIRVGDHPCGRGSRAQPRNGSRRRGSVAQRTRCSWVSRRL